MARVRVAGLVAAVLAAVLAVAAPTGVVGAADVAVASAPRTDVLQVVDGEVLDSAVVGGKVVLVGNFTQVREPGGATYDQAYIAAYDLSSGAFDVGFRPAVDRQVNVVRASEDASALYIGGPFRTVDGQTARKIAKISAAGTLDPSFSATPSASVEALAVGNGRVYLGGKFGAVSGVPRGRLAALDAQTGAVDAGFDFPLTDSVGAGGAISVKSLALTPDATKLFLSHSARLVGGQLRTGIARIDVGPGGASVSDWQTLVYEDELERLGGVIRPRRLAVSPDGTYVVVVNSGGDKPPTNDTAIKLPVAGGAGVTPDWVSRHFDTVLGVTISPTAVFVGGHFQYQEAPGSTDPFPGDPDVVYGFGQNQGPAILGDEVVARRQLGALDPSTGKSMSWNPGSDSFIGVQSLTWVDGHGLLVGHDANELGGLDVGRHGFFPLGGGDDVPPPPPPPEGDTFICIAYPAAGDAFVQFGGVRGTGEALRQNGRWVATVVGRDDIIIPGGAGDDYSVRVRGNGFDSPYEEFTCSVGGEVDPGGVALDTFIDAPLPGSLVPNDSDLTISGRATAQGGAAKIRLSLVNRQTGQYVRPDGTQADGWAAIDVLPDTAGDDTTWSIDVPLSGAGTYRLTAKTFANDGTKDATNAVVAFTVGAQGDLPPHLTISSPSGVTTSPVTFSGRATDDLGIESVTFLVLDRNSNLYLNPDGSLGQAHRFATTLASPGATDTLWETTLSVPAGSWQATVDAIDTSGQRDRLNRSFTQPGDVTPPEIQIDAGLVAKDAPGQPFTFTGSASAAAGIERVEIIIKNPLDNSGLQNNGQLGTIARYFPIVQIGAQETQVDWSYTSPPLPAGSYQVTIRVVDALGATDAARADVVAGVVGDAEPNALFSGATRFAQGLDEVRHTFTGTATDDSGVANVLITVYEPDMGKWLQVDGQFGSAPEPRVVAVDSPGAPSTTWSFLFEPPQAGTYYVYAWAVDDAGQLDVARHFGSARLYPGDALPEPGVLLPVANADVTGTSIAVTGRATDDIAVDRVQVRIRNLDTGQFLRNDGSLGSSQWLTASLTNVGGAGTNWDFVSPDLPAGSYQVSARATDNHGQVTSPVDKRNITLTG